MPETHSGWFVTGTDTGVGKTYACRLILKALRDSGYDAAGYKPVCCGSREDASLLQNAGPGSLSLDDINPLWFQAPLSPFDAAREENRIADLLVLEEGCRRLANRFRPIVVEGAGGWKVPLASGVTMADLARFLDLPVLVVARNRLGALNHTLLTIESVLNSGLPCAGILLNGADPQPDAASLTNRSTLEQFASVPVLGEIRYGATSLDFPLPLDRLKC
jgi:dethiobiotin synthetase